MTRGTTRQAAWAAPILALLLVVGGCSADGDAASGTAAGGDAAAVEAPAADEGGVEAPADSSDRLVIQTGSVQMTVDEPEAATEQVVDLVEGKGGRVDARAQSAASQDATAWASLTVRVPADQVNATVTALREIGDVDAIDLKAQDVTGTAQDLDARIHALELSVDRMEQLMADATSTRDLLAAESALSERQGNLEQLQSERARLADQVALSTLDITISGPGALPVQTTQDGTFLSGLESGWDALVTTIGVLMVVLGAVLPWLVVVGIVGLVWMAVRRRRRRRSAATAPATAPPVPTVTVGARTTTRSGDDLSD